jgi:hypothetical protein
LGERRGGKDGRGGEGEKREKGVDGGVGRGGERGPPLSPALSEEKKIPPLPLLAIGGSRVPPAAQKKREKIGL